MRIFKVILLVGAILCVTAVGVGAASAASYNGHRVRVALVGGIDASPCTNPYGCAKGIVELRYNGHARQHLVRCPYPKHLHVAAITRNRNGVRADVFACSRHYLWRLP
jgi:hypothetical protein